MPARIRADVRRQWSADKAPVELWTDPDAGGIFRSPATGETDGGQSETVAVAGEDQHVVPVFLPQQGMIIDDTVQPAAFDCALDRLFNRFADFGRNLQVNCVWLWQNCTGFAGGIAGRDEQRWWRRGEVPFNDDLWSGQDDLWSRQGRLCRDVLSQRRRSHAPCQYDRWKQEQRCGGESTRHKNEFRCDQCRRFSAPGIAVSANMSRAETVPQDAINSRASVGKYMYVSGEFLSICL